MTQRIENLAEDSSKFPELFKIEIPTVSEEDYLKTREAVKATGAFIVPIRSVSIKDLLEEDGQREQSRWSYVNNSKTMRATVPPEMEVFIRPNAVRIEENNWFLIDAHKSNIAKAAASYRQQLPEEVRGFVDLHMVDPSTYSQIEDAWMDAGGGLLLPDFFACTDIKTVWDRDTFVGRLDPDGLRMVVDWYYSYGFNFNHVFAVPVGVLPRKLAA